MDRALKLAQTLQRVFPEIDISSPKTHIDDWDQVCLVLWTRYFAPLLYPLWGTHMLTLSGKVYS